MIKHTLNDQTIILHQDVSEIEFNDFCDFLTIEKEVLDGKRDHVEGMVELAKVFVANADDLPYGSHTKNIFTSISITNIYLYYINLFNDYSASIIDSTISYLKKKEELDQHEIQILDTHQHYTSAWERINLALFLTQNYYSDIIVTEDELCFKHEGEQFYLNGDMFKNYFRGSSFRAGEVSTVMDFRRRIKAQAGEGNIPEDGDMQYTIRLHDLAVLCRKQDEKLPSDKVERKRFIDDRMELFRTLKMDKVFSVVFFLTRACGDLVNEAIIEDTTRGITQRLAQSKEVQKAR